MDVVLKQEASSYGTVSPKESYSPILPPVNGVSKQEQTFDPPIQRGELQNGVIDSPPPDKVRNLLIPFTSLPIDRTQDSGSFYHSITPRNAIELPTMLGE